MTRNYLFISLVLVALLLAGCRRAATTGPTAVPTLSPTPRSTPLPAVPTAIPAGADANPIRMVLVPTSTLSTARNATTLLEQALLDESGLTVELVLADRFAEGVGALCESVDNAVTVAWLDGISSVAATEQDCGSATLRVDRGGDGTGMAVQMVAHANLGVTSLGSLNGRSFCRVGYDDLYTWLVPSLLLAANGIEPLTDLGSVTDYADAVDLLNAVASGECDFAGVAEVDYADADTEVRANLTPLTESVELPYSVLVYPPTAGLGVRRAIDDALLAIIADPERADLLDDLLGAVDLEPIDADDLRPVRNFARDSGLDFTALGR